MSVFKFSNGITCENKCFFKFSNKEWLNCSLDELPTSEVNATLLKVHHQHCEFVVPKTEWKALLNS